MEEVVAADSVAARVSEEVQIKVLDTAPDKGLEEDWAPIYPPSAGGSPIGREDGGLIQPTPMRCQRNILSRTQIDINTCSLPRSCSHPSSLTVLSSPCKASQLT